MRLIIKKDFAFAHKGYERAEYTEGQVVESDDEEFIAVSTREGWASDADAEPEQEQEAEGKEKKRRGRAPENKAHDGADGNKEQGGE